ncbi:hypothetical protein PPACK8108_LOCUS25708 [Phakopsora pachyrhizi]|uniref:CSEP-07 n=1 Tax=Phakopsora pachyrhizi TaxID=170000 RepID=A0A0S1MJK1_PHAPC
MKLMQLIFYMLNILALTMAHNCCELSKMPTLPEIGVMSSKPVRPKPIQSTASKGTKFLPTTLCIIKCKFNICLAHANVINSVQIGNRMRESKGAVNLNAPRHHSF